MNGMTFVQTVGERKYIFVARFSATCEQEQTRKPDEKSEFVYLSWHISRTFMSV